MSDTVYVVYESVAQSHEQNRTDLANESVLTFPVIDVYESEAEAEAEGLEYTEAPAAWF